MTTGIKLLSALAGIGVVGGAGATTYYFLKDDSISIGQALKDKGHTLLNFDTNKTQDKATWEPIVKAYSSNQNKLDNLTIQKIESSGTVTQKNINDLKKACANIIGSNNNEETLKIAEQYCVTPITIKDFLSKSGKVLDTNENDQGNTKEWDDKVNAYPTQGTKPLGELQLSSGEPKAKRNEIRKACQKIEAKKTYETDFHSELKKFEEWCFVPNKK